MPVRSKLTVKQAAFLKAYLTNGRDAAKAYRASFNTKASPLAVSKDAARLLKHPLIVPIISRAEKKAELAVENSLNRYAVTEASVKDEMARVAFSDPRGVVKWGTRLATADEESGEETREAFVEPIDSDQLTDAQAAAIQEISMGPKGIKIKLHDKMAALRGLGQHLGLFPKESAVNVNISLDALVLASFKVENGD